MLAVVVTGPPGAGKSAVATAAHDALGDAGVANALVEVDELERAYPPVEPARVLRHLAALCASYREAGHDLLFVTATLETGADRQAVLDAIGAGATLLVRLEAPPATLAKRIRAREPASWAGLDELVAASARLAAQMPAELADADLVLPTGARRAEDVAREVVAAVRERRTG